MISFGQFVAIEEGYINFGDYHLEQRFNHWNSILFGGTIPQCPVEWADLKQVAGVTTYSFKRITQALTPGTLKIQISTHFKRTEEMLDSTIIHEMIHAYMAVHGYPKEQHGFRFRAMALKCEEVTRIKIPVTDDLSPLELTSTKDTQTTVLIRHITKANQWGVIFYSGTALDSAANQNAVKAFWGVPGRLPAGESITVMKVMTSLTQKYHRTNALAAKSTRFSFINDTEANDLLQHGKVMFTIDSGSVSHEFAAQNLPTTEVLVVLRTNTRNNDTAVGFFSPAIAKDHWKLNILFERWKKYHDAGYNIEIFTTRTILNRIYTLQRDPTGTWMYRPPKETIDSLRRNASYLAQWFI